MDKGRVRQIFTELLAHYSVLPEECILTYGNPGDGNAARAVREGRFPEEFYTIILREPNVEHLLHEFAHVIEWWVHGDSSNHGYRWMQYYEELESLYAKAL